MGSSLQSATLEENEDNGKSAQKYKENIQPKSQQKKEKMLAPPVPAKCNFVYIHPKIHDYDQNVQQQDSFVIKQVKSIHQNDLKQDSKEKHEKDTIIEKKNEKSEIGRILVQRNAFTKIKKKNYLDDYIHVKDVGQGSYGRVCKLKMKYTGLLRAAKIIQCSLLNKKENEKEKALNQVFIPMKLDHPNLNKLYEVYLWKDKLTIIMQLCEGGDLFNFIKQSNTFSEKIVADIMKQILSAVLYMHNNNIVHRDLKPENILYEKNKGVPKIIDFGTAIELSPKTSLSKLVGSIYYLAPEVIKGNYNEKCDIWSCGIILYVLLCGHAPFYSSKESQTMRKIMNDPLEFKSTIWVKRSSEVKKLISQMLQKDPQKRISAHGAYSSPWFMLAQPGSVKEIQTQFLGNLSTFHFKNKLKAVVYTYIASQLYSDEDKDRLLKAFQEFDKDGNGVIQKCELVKIFEQYNKNTFSESEIEKIIQLVDTNDSGLIDFTEFLVAASNQEQLLKRQRLENAFSYLDTDRSGYITIQQIKNFLFDEESSLEELKAIFDEVDKNGDGKITKNQFLSLLMNHKK